MLTSNGRALQETIRPFRVVDSWAFCSGIGLTLETMIIAGEPATMMVLVSQW